MSIPEVAMVGGPIPSMTKTWHQDTYEAINPSNSNLSVKGKTVVITGGSSGIGRATARAFAQAGAADVAILARRTELLKETKQIVKSEFPTVNITSHTVDISDQEQVQTAAAEIGDWDILVMNAGYLSGPASIAESSLDEWWKGWEVNIKGAFLLAQAFLPNRTRNAVVIGTSSATVLLDPKMQAKYSSYGVSKLALIRLFEIMGAEYPDTHFVTYHPGVVKTEMHMKSKMEGLPIDTAELPAHFAVWLASPEASFLRGKFVWTNWDVDELEQKAKEIKESPIMTATIAGWPYQP